MNYFRSRKKMLILNSRGPNLNTKFLTEHNTTNFCDYFACAWMKKDTLYDKFIDSSKEYSRFCGTVDSPFLTLRLAFLLTTSIPHSSSCSKSLLFPEVSLQPSCLTLCLQFQVHMVPKHLVQTHVAAQVVYILSLMTTFEILWLRKRDWDLQKMHWIIHQYF